MNFDDTRYWLANAEPFGIPLTAYGLALAAAVVSFVALRLALAVGLRQVSRIAKHSQTRIDDVMVEVLSRTSPWLLALASLLIGLGMLDLPERWHNRVDQLWFVALALQFALWAHRALGLFMERYVARQAGGNSKAQASASATLLSWGLRTVLWAVVLLAVLSNLGVNVTAFVASLGVGGIAVALAVQNILGDLFASLSIAVDKPFEVGDSIAVQNFSGAVEHIGLKTTRIRSLSGEQIVISNTDLLKQPVRNYKRMADRRIEFRFSISNTTPPEQAAAIPGLVRKLVESNEQLRFDRAHLVGFKENSIDYEAVYIVRTADYQLHMDLQQKINLELMREFARQGIAFAAPTRVIHMPAA
jgi:small-conductance mechanosensitive channel